MPEALKQLCPFSGGLHFPNLLRFEVILYLSVSVVPDAVPVKLDPDHFGIALRAFQLKAGHEMAIGAPFVWKVVCCNNRHQRSGGLVRWRVDNGA